MSPTPPLTEEELARIEEAIWSGSMHASSRRMAAATLSRLIAALRASRAEVERLREQNDGLYQATLMLSTEVERLWAWIEFTGEHQPTEADFTEALEWVRRLRQARA